MLSAKVISIIFVCVLSSWLVVQFLLLFSVCIYLSLIIFVFLYSKAAACMLQAAAKYLYILKDRHIKLKHSAGSTMRASACQPR